MTKHSGVLKSASHALAGMNNQIEQAIDKAIALYWHNISTMQQISPSHNIAVLG
ncbi:hypothetical protein [Nostoc sp. ChiQUE01b]|uniref:hypothetical protein n=1 Tax=Nostoc sp. ChiQUE01b TaxID=3075376 RepID=UPI002AD4F6FC|nr:hypothetical protein [Nostoc sp. ChiQUE01b]MDZ8257187.1 hypothetical protein [Nostoc sp. ChiQUE01b]